MVPPSVINSPVSHCFLPSSPPPNNPHLFRQIPPARHGAWSGHVAFPPVPIPMEGEDQAPSFLSLPRHESTTSLRDQTGLSAALVFAGKSLAKPCDFPGFPQVLWVAFRRIW